MTARRTAPKRRATARDVARVAGVSVSAVSRSFTPGASASEDVRRRVAAAASQLGYRPNAMARSITTRRTHLTGVILATDTNLQYPELLSEIARAMSRKQYRIMLFSLDSMSELEGTLDQVWSYQLDGVLAAVRISDPQIGSLEDHGVPVVLFNRAPSRRLVASVSCDHSACGRQLAEHLIAQGHRAFALIHGPTASTVGAERMSGVRETLREAGAKLVEERGDFSYESGHRAFATLVPRRRPEFTAVIAASDQMALGALDCARHRLALRVPRDLSIAGFDGIRAARWDSYDLTTVRQPMRAMSEAAAELLIGRMGDAAHPAERRVFPGELLVGRSTGPSAR